MAHGCPRNVPGSVCIADIPVDNSTNLLVCGWRDFHLYSAAAQAVDGAILWAGRAASCSYMEGQARAAGDAVVAGVPEAQRSS